MTDIEAHALGFENRPLGEQRGHDSPLIVSSAQVDLKKFGFAVEALLHIGLAKQRRRAVALFLEKLRSLSEVREFFVVTGRFDLIVHIAVRDTDHLKDFEYALTSRGGNSTRCPRPCGSPVSRDETKCIQLSVGRSMWSMMK